MSKTPATQAPQDAAPAEEIPFEPLTDDGAALTLTGSDGSELSVENGADAVTLSGELAFEPGAKGAADARELAALLLKVAAACESAPAKKPRRGH